jgi:hypothetical protein
MDGYCIDILYSIFQPDIFDFTIIPCTRDGKILNFVIGDKIGIDINSTTSGIVNIDYFDYYPEIGMKILVFCKPPIGKFVEFFNYSSKFADVIAFILPVDFRNPGIQNKLNLNFELECDTDLYDNFCFQVWKRVDFTLE